MKTSRALVTALAAVLAVLAPLRGAAQAPATQTLTFPAAADTYVDAGTPTKNLNSSVELKADAVPVRVTYLRFAIAGVNGRAVLQARLRLGCIGPTVSGGAIHRISNNAWNEGTINFNTRPTVDGPPLHTLGAVALNTVAEFNLDGAIASDGLYSFAIDNASDDGVTYTSSDATSGQKPALVLTVANGPEPNVDIVQPTSGAQFFVGDAVTLQATATDAVDGDLSANVAWTDNLQGPLGTGASLVRQLVQGSHDITATVSDHDGNAGLDRVTITVTPPPPGNTAPLVTISTPVPGQGYTADVPVSFTGSATDLEDGNLASALTWSSDRDGALGTGASFSRLLSAGTHQITARARDAGGLTGETTIAITVAAPVTLEFTPQADAYVDSGSPTTKFGTNALLRADANTTRISYLRFVVSGLGSQQVARAVVRLQGDAGTSAGSDVGGIIRRISDVSWVESTVTYNTRPTLDGTILSMLGAVTPGQVVDFDVTAAMTGDGTYSFALTNSSSDGADYRSREGGPAPRLIVTLSGNAPVVAVMAPANQSVFFAGAPISFQGNASDVEDGDLASQLGWSSSLDGLLGTGASIASSSLRVGTHTITAGVTDSDGHRGEGQITIRVRGANVPPTVAIGAPLNGATVPAGTTVTLAGSATDDFDGSLSGAIQWTSSRDGALGGGASINRVLSEGSHTITASATDSDGASGTASIGLQITPTAPVVTINSPAANAVVFNGAPMAFSGSATDATDGNLSASLAWVSDRDGAIGTGASFSLTSLSVGTHVITASVRDQGGLLGQAQRTITVRPPNALPTITIGGPLDGTALLSGKPVLITATAQDAENGNLASRVRWTSSLAGVLGTGTPLTVPTLAVGTHVLTADVTDLDGAAASASVTVTLSPSSFTFLPSADTYVDSGKATTNFGTSTTLWADNSPMRQMFFRFPVAGLGPFAVDKAILRLTVGSASASASAKGGTVSAISNHTWTEANTTYNTRPAVDGAMLATRATSVKVNAVIDFDVTAGVAADGTYDFALVTTSSDEVVYQSRESAKKPQLVVTLKQNTGPAVTITAPASGTTAIVGAPVTFTGSASDAESGNLSAQIRWSSSLSGLLGTGASLTVASLVPGTHVITATVSDPSGATATAQTSITVDHPPVVAITAPADGAVVFTNQFPVTFRGTASDTEDGNLGAQIAWSSSIDGSLGTGITVVRPTLSVGTHVIRATVTDAAGAAGQASITIRVRNPNVAPQVAITVPVGGFSTPAGSSLTMIATASDDFDGDITSRIAWSDGATALGTGGSLTRILAEGPHTLTATVTDSDGVVGSAQVSGTVSPTAPVVTITAPATGVPLFAGNPLTFAGTAVDATQGDMSAAIRWSSSLDGPFGTGASVTTSALRVGTHVITAAVTDASSLTGQAQQTVIVKPPDVPPTVTITSPASGASYPAGSPVSLAATASDFEDGNLSASIRWTSSLDGALGTGATLNVSSLSPGTQVLTATVTDLDGAQSSASVTITVISAASRSVRDFTFGSTTEDGDSNEATAQKPESKLWFVDGFWWATFDSPTGGGHHIFKFNAATSAWTDTGVLVDSRPPARQDVLWDGSKLYMVSRYRVATGPARLLRYSYNSSAKMWSMDAGFPLDIPGNSGMAESITIAKDSTGTLWIAFALNAKVYVNHTLGSDTSWDQPFLLPFAEGAVKDDGAHATDIAGVIAMNGMIGVFWSNQLLNKDFFAVHRDSDPATTWTLETAGSGGKFSDDHFNMKFAADGRLFVMIKTNYSTTGQILDGLLVRSASGTWSPLYSISRVEFNATRELIQLDEVHRKIYAFYSLDHAAIYYKVSDMDTIGFPEGAGSPFIESSSVTDINNPTGSKQSIDATTGLLVEASSRGDNSYWHTFLPIAP